MVLDDDDLESVRQRIATNAALKLGTLRSNRNERDQDEHDCNPSLSTAGAR
jgi:hypothetical protein